MIRSLFLILLCLSSTVLAKELNSNALNEKQKIRCGNLIYAGTRSSVCFANKFLNRLKTETTINVAPHFKDTKLSSEEFFSTAFSIMSGENNFSLSATEKENLRIYLENGGFLLASPNCSNKQWDQSFRKLFSEIFPENKMKKISMDHPIFTLVYPVKTLHLKSGGVASVEGLFIDKRLVMVYSKEGLNDVSNAKGCCCCGGNEIKESQKVNVNVFTYALLH